MNELERYRFEELNLKTNLQRIGDLVNMDGPMLVLFHDISNEDLYVYDWVDDDKHSNRWLIYKVAKDDLVDFLRKNISYKTLFEKNSEILYYTDIFHNDLKSFKIFRIEVIPNEYKPDKDVLFDIDDSRNFDKILSKLNLDNGLNSKENLTEYNILTGIKLFSVLSTQNYDPLITWDNIPINNLTLQIHYHYQIFHTQSDAPKVNRIPSTKGLVLQ